MVLEKLMDSPIAWLVLALCAIFSLLFAVFTWIKGKAKREISCYKTSYEIVRAGKSLIPELHLTFREQEIEDLVITKYAIWNSGNQVLNWKDIVESKPLRVVTSNEMTQILDVKIIKQSDESNMFSVEKNEVLGVDVKFDYAEVNDGIVLQIVHTGNPNDIQVECKIKGGRKIKNINKDRKKSTGKKSLKILMVVETILVMLCVLLSGVGMIGAVAEILHNISYLNAFEASVSLVLSVGILAGIIMMGILYVNLLKKVYHINVPAKIRTGIAYDEFEN